MAQQYRCTVAMGKFASYTGKVEELAAMSSSRRFIPGQSCGVVDSKTRKALMRYKAFGVHRVFEFEEIEDDEEPVEVVKAAKVEEETEDGDSETSADSDDSSEDSVETIPRETPQALRRKRTKPRG